MHEEESLYLTISPRSERHLLREKSARRSLGRAIGGLSSGAKNIKDIPFDPNAEDGDGDGEVQDNTRWARPAVPNIPDGNSAEYRGQHAAPGKDDGAPLHDMTKVYPEDVYSSEGRRIYATGEDRIDSQAFELIAKLRGKPNAIVTVYRAVPISPSRRIDELEKQKAYILKHGAIPPRVRTYITNTSEYYDLISQEIEDLKEKPKTQQLSISQGDWVTPFRSYAVEHGESNLGGRGQYEVVKRRVRAGDIYTAGDSWAEWGYDPRDEEVTRGLASGGKDKKSQQKKVATESPRAYTLWEYMNEKRNRGEPVDVDEEMAAQAIDGLAEHVLAKFVGGKISPLEQDFEIFQTLGIALEIDLSNSSHEVALMKAVESFNKKFGSNHKKTSLLVGALQSSLATLDEDEIKRVIESLDKDELKKIHESTDYNYGDLNLLTGERIYFGSHKWLRGMTPKQIAKLVTPETEDELLEMSIHYNFGRDTAEELVQLKNRMDRGESLSADEIAAVQVFVKTLAGIAREVKLDKFNSDGIPKLRESIELALSRSPLFLSAVHSVGLPPISLTELPGYHEDFDAEHSRRTYGLFSIAQNIISLNHLLPKVNVNREAEWEKEIGIHEIIRGRPTSSRARPKFMGDLVIDTLIHEWGHYLWFTLARGLGIKPSSLDPNVASNKEASKMFDKLSKQEKDELLSFLKLFDYGTESAVFERTINGGGYFDKSKGFSSRSGSELQDRRNLQTRSKQFAARISMAMEAYERASGVNEKKRALDALEMIISEVVSSKEIFVTSEYGATKPQEAFAELIKDYLSPAYSTSRQDLISQGAIDVLDKIFDFVKTIGGK